MSVIPNDSAAIIPEESEVKTTGQGGVWRFSRGEIVRGKQDAIEKRDSQAPAGILRRIGIHEKLSQDGTQLAYIEADIETSKGLEFFHCSLNDDEGNLKPSTATVGFAWGLGNIGKNEQIRLTCSQSNFTTEKGAKVTFVNVWKSPNQDWKFEQCIRPKRDKDADKVSLTDQWLALRPLIEKHPAFANRPADRQDDSEGNATTHLSALCKESAAKGWPTPEQAPSEWLSIMAKVYGEANPRASLGQWGDDEWGEIRLKLSEKTDVPSWLAPAVERLSGKPKVADQSALLD